MNHEQTIAALATPPGEGGIGIIRISGKKSFDIAREIFKSDKVNFENIKNRYLYYGFVVNPENKKIIDEVLLACMKAPYTYTREDIVEINCHGGMVPIKETLEIVYAHGARPAEPGEFTKRAFLNGRLDLSQAEGVIDLITSKTDILKDVALDQVKGDLRKQIENLRGNLMTVLANLEAKIDFPEEDIEVLKNDELIEIVDFVLMKVKEFIESYDKGKIIKEGIKTVIIGRPNVGKSSLLNTLLGEDRAIVTDIPGTTRDTIEEIINLEGIPLKIIDTAGIRETSEKIEKIGVERTKNLIGMADLALIIIDSSQDITEEDVEILKLCNEKRSIILLNKSDLQRKVKKEDIKKYFPGQSNEYIKILEISALKAQGIKELKSIINHLVFEGYVYQGKSMIITNSRQYSSLKRVEDNLSSAVEGLRLYESEDLISIDIKNAYDYLGEIIGTTVSEDVIDEIFGRFCIGK